MIATLKELTALEKKEQENTNNEKEIINNEIC
jgi:hypothetical protein